MRSTQYKGDVAVARAVSVFTEMGFDVLLPLTESASYDLAVDTRSGVKRVQVKYCSQRHVDLRRVHSNSTGYIVKKSLKNSYDWLFILDENGNEYLIKRCLYGRRAVTLQPNYLIQKKNLKNLFNTK